MKKRYILLGKTFGKLERVVGHIDLTPNDAKALNRAYKTAGLKFRVIEGL